MHVSFVRSISMDAFKQNEILRMQYGGNKAWQDFYTKNSPIPFDEATIKERYDGEVGEEWKERLTARVEDREFDKAAFLKDRQAILQKQASRTATPAAGGVRNNNNISSGPGSRTVSPAPVKGAISAEQKAQNEAYFARMGDANASRPQGLPPSQGGKYGGFGSAAPEPPQQTAGIPSADEFSKDPVAALTKGFGWFSAAVGKQAKLVNESYIQPTAKNVAPPPLLVLVPAKLLTIHRGRSRPQTLQRRPGTRPLQQVKGSRPEPKAPPSRSTSSSRARTTRPAPPPRPGTSNPSGRTFGTASVRLQAAPPSPETALGRVR